MGDFLLIDIICRNIEAKKKRLKSAKLQEQKKLKTKPQDVFVKTLKWLKNHVDDIAGLQTNFFN